MKRRLTAWILALVLSLSLCACGKQGMEANSEETREFTDSCGRTVTIPKEVTRVALTGPLTQLYALPLCKDIMVGFTSDYGENLEKYIGSEFKDLPVIGQLYGGKGTMDLEALLAAAPDVVIDIGEEKDGIKEDMDALSEQTGIPFVHINGSIQLAPEAYRALGELTGKTEKAEELAAWCENAYERAVKLMERVDADGARKRLLYCLGDKGLNVIAEGSYHAGVLNLMADNAAKLDDVASSGLGNEVDFEQILLWNPDVIVFAPDSIYGSVFEEERWMELDAISNGAYYKTPYGPYGWLSTPPSVQCYLGIIWLGALLYPEYVDYDLQEETTEYYKLFYGFDMSGENYAELIENAMPTA